MQHRLRSNTRGGHRAKVKFSNNITRYFQTVLSRTTWHRLKKETQEAKKNCYTELTMQTMYMFTCARANHLTPTEEQRAALRETHENGERALSFLLPRVSATSAVIKIRTNSFPQNTGPQHNLIYCHLLLGRVKKNPSFPPCSRVSHLRCNKDPTQLFSSKHRTST